MATIVASAAGGSWNVTTTWVGGVVPTAADDVQLTSTSGSVTITGNARCRSLDCTGYTGTLNSANAGWQIGTSTPGLSNIAVKLSSTMTVSGGQACTLVSTSSTTQTIDLAGRTLPFAFAVAGAGSSYQLTSAFATTSTLSVTSGTLDTNGQSVTCSSFSSNGATARTVTLGSSTFTVTTSGTSWTLSGSNLTFNAGTSTIVVSSPTAPVFTGGGYTYYDVSFTNTSPQTITVNGTNTFHNLTFATSVSISSGVSFGADQIINGTFTVQGSNNTTTRYPIGSAVSGQRITLTVAAAVFANVDFQDIAGAGAYNWNVSAVTGLAGDMGNNSGITFVASVTQTMTITGNVTWTAYAWSTRVPLAHDDVNVVNTSGVSRQITFGGRALCRNLDFSGSTAGVTFISTGYLYGNLVGHALLSGTGSINFLGRGTKTIKTNGGTLFTCNFDVGSSSSYQLLDDLVSASSIQITTGTLDLNGHNATCTVFSAVNNALAKTLNFGDGTLYLTSTSATTVFTGQATSQLTCVTTVNSQIVISTASASTRTFTGNSNSTYPTLRYDVANSAGQLTINGSNTFRKLIVTGNSGFVKTLAITSTTTQTFTNLLKLTTVNLSPTSTTNYTFSVSATGRVVCSDISLARATATGGATFYAGAGATDGGNNSGWTFSDFPAFNVYMYNFTTSAWEPMSSTGSSSGHTKDVPKTYKYSYATTAWDLVG